DESNGYMFTGDLIYKGTLYAFYPSTDPVKYRESVIKISNTEGIKKVFPGHYDYNQEKDIIKETENAFNEINKKNRLKQGEGIFEFENIKIQI
ncbi:MAG TPA: MBL fold metallo-hydrolase, partial [Tepiditoga sp.]|nr:MBL fold metallo-hydrolase [Tepiditoga sp.]